MSNTPSELELLRRQRDYLVRCARIPARVVHYEPDPAGSTIDYEPPKEAVELFGDSLSFVCGDRPYFYLVPKEKR